MREQDLLIAAATTAWRPDDPQGRLRGHPAWHDLDANGRRELFRVTRIQRLLEAAADAAGLSTTARRVLERIRRRG